MKKVNSIFIDLRNDKQVKWWNDTASKLVRVVRYDTIVETATNKTVGVIFAIKGLHKNRIINENIKFLNNPKTIVIKRASVLLFFTRLIHAPL